jgi:ketosteroid isomerase-like protein
MNSEFDELAEAETLGTLLALNADYIRAFAESDVDWYDEHLTPSFVCTLANGRRIGKTEFLERTTGGPNAYDVTFDVVDVNILGDVALVHGTTHYVRDGAARSTSYTDVWTRDGRRWFAVAAQLTAVTE